ncbi:MAG: hypothetical protein N2510_06770 [Ignavibacteria bacterium]|nr:hypothetical protein [Ignavibacteria bacterium]
MKYLYLPVFLVFSLFTACSDNVTEVEETDDQFIRSVIYNGYAGQNNEDDDLIFSERNDFSDGGPVGNLIGDTPLDSLIAWGRIVNNVNRNISISSEGDTIKNVNITTTVNGTLIIIGVLNSVVDTIYKPYINEFRRLAVFKRIARTPRPRFNWRLYKISVLDGESKSPQIGTQFVEMNKIEVFINGALRYTFNGPDFTQNIFTTRFFGGEGIPEVNINDEVKLKVYLYSTQQQADLVNWHWSRRFPGRFRESFQLVSETPSGSGWERVYEKTFNISSSHQIGRFNGFISAITRESLWDDNPSKLAGDFVATPYRVKP